SSRTVRSSITDQRRLTMAGSSRTRSSTDVMPLWVSCLVICLPTPQTSLTGVAARTVSNSDGVSAARLQTCDAFAQPCVDLVFAYPLVKGLCNAPDLGAQSTQWPPMWTGIRRDALAPCVQLARELQGKNDLISCSWLHLLKVWSLLNFRRFICGVNGHSGSAAAGDKHADGGGM
ncbi:MAG: hypothetical protein ACD_23C00489G0001, partial [uncultured bacterium]